MVVIVLGRGTCRGRASDTPDVVVVICSRNRTLDKPDAVVVFCGRGMGVPSVSRYVSSTGVRGRGCALDTPNAVVTCWGCGCCPGRASDPPDAVVIVWGRGLW